MTEPVLFDFDRNFRFSQNVKFKFVLLQTPDCSLLVRGWTAAEFHADVAEEAERRENTKFTVIGGGRIHVNNGNILVYGHSLGFPWPKGHSRNELVAEILKINLSGCSITWSNEGY